jgi:uncharacterized protein
MLGGLLGILLPFIPGLPIVWLGFFIFAIGTGFKQISISLVIGFFVLMLLTLMLDFFSGYLGIRKYKASIWSIIGSFLGFLIGIIFFNIAGAILGPFIGAFLGELIATRNLQRGFQAMLGAIVGSIIGTLLKVTVALIMIGVFIISFF